MSASVRPVLTLRTPPRYGRRAVWAALASLGLFGLSFGIDAAAANQIGYSERPAIWTLFFSALALYYSVICAFRWWFRRREKARDIQRRIQE